MNLEKEAKLKQSNIVKRKKEESDDHGPGERKKNKANELTLMKYVSEFKPVVQKKILQMIISDNGVDITEAFKDIALCISPLEPGNLKYSCVSALLAQANPSTLWTITAEKINTGDSEATGGTYTKANQQ